MWLAHLQWKYVIKILNQEWGLQLTEIKNKDGCFAALACSLPGLPAPQLRHNPTSHSFFISSSMPPKLTSKLLNVMDTLKFLSCLISKYHLNQLVFPLETLFSFENTLSGFILLQWLLLFLFLWEFVFCCCFYCWCSSWCVDGPFCLLSLRRGSLFL